MEILLSQIRQIPGRVVVNDSKLICYVTYSLFMRCLIWTYIFLNKGLVSTHCCNIVMLFLAMVEKYLRTLIFCLLFWFVTSFEVIGLSKGSFLTSSLKHCQNLFENLDYPQFHQFHL